MLTRVGVGLYALAVRWVLQKARSQVVPGSSLHPCQGASSLQFVRAQPAVQAAHVRRDAHDCIHGAAQQTRTRLTAQGWLLHAIHTRDTP